MQPIRLDLLSSHAQDALNQLVQRVEHSLDLLGITTMCVRTELFGLLGIQVPLAELRHTQH